MATMMMAGWEFDRVRAYIYKLLYAITCFWLLHNSIHATLQYYVIIIIIAIVIIVLIYETHLLSSSSA